MTQGDFEACWQNGTSVSHTLIRPGQSPIVFRQASQPRNQRETDKAKGRGRGRTAVSVYTKKLQNLRNCSRRSIKGHNSKEASRSLTLLADARVTKKKSTESNPGGRMDAKDQRLETSYTPTPLKISRRRSNRSSRCFHTKRPSPAMKHRGRWNFLPHRAEACRNQQPIPHTGGDKQLWDAKVDILH